MVSNSYMWSVVTLLNKFGINYKILFLQYSTLTQFINRDTTFLLTLISIQRRVDFEMVNR
jgi:hypothetical protein